MKIQETTSFCVVGAEIVSIIDRVSFGKEDVEYYMAICQIKDKEMLVKILTWEG